MPPAPFVHLVEYKLPSQKICCVMGSRPASPLTEKMAQPVGPNFPAKIPCQWYNAPAFNNDEPPQVFPSRKGVSLADCG